MSNFVLLNAIATKADRTEAFSLVISEPISRNEECFCEVEAPLLFDGRKSIHGIDASQAKELAVGFVKQLIEFSDWQISYKDGTNVEIFS